MIRIKGESRLERKPVKFTREKDRNFIKNDADKVSGKWALGGLKKVRLRILMHPVRLLQAPFHHLHYPQKESLLVEVSASEFEFLMPIYLIFLIFPLPPM